MSAMLCLLLTLLVGVRGQTPSSLIQNFNYHPQVRQFLEETSAAPTRQGPVVFPSSPLNNSIPASSGVSRVFQPYRYRPFVPMPYGDKQYDLEQPTLPPIYKALSDHANDNLAKVTRKNEANLHRQKKDDYDYNDLSSEDEQNQKYAFSYTVKDHKTGDDFSHSQHSSGSATNGEYRVRLPDGRTQIVSYTADENGYKADVRYDNDDDGFNANSNVGNIANGFNANSNLGNNANGYNANSNIGNNANGFNANSNVGNNNPIKYNAVDNYNANNIVVSDNVYKYNAIDNIRNNAIKYNAYNNVGNNDAVKYNAFNANNVNNAYKQRVDNVYTHAINKYLQNNDYERDEIPIKEEINEYDYSAEYDKTYTPKFQIYDTETKFVPTVRPSYEEIKDLFTKIQVTTPVYDFQKPNEKVVVIGNRYTDVRSTLGDYQSPTTPYFIPDPVTSKPILSQNYINRINKYLTFN